MSIKSELNRIRLRWTPKRVAIEFIYRLHKRQMNQVLLNSLLARMKRDIDSRFHPTQASGEYAGAIKQVLFLIEIYAAAICPVLEAMADVARLVTSTLMLVEFGQVGPRGRLPVLVDASNQLLLRVAIMEKLLLKHSVIAAVPQGTLGALLGLLQAHVLLTCRLLTEKRMEDIGLLLDYETLMQQAEDDLERLESSARQAADEIGRLSKTACSICEKEVTVASRLTDLITTSEVMNEAWWQKIDNWERARQEPRRPRRPKAKSKCRSQAKTKRRPKAKSEAKSKPKRKRPLHRTAKR